MQHIEQTGHMRYVETEKSITVPKSFIYGTHHLVFESNYEQPSHVVSATTAGGSGGFFSTGEKIHCAGADAASTVAGADPATEAASLRVGHTHASTGMTMTAVIAAAMNAYTVTTARTPGRRSVPSPRTTRLTSGTI